MIGVDATLPGGLWLLASRWSSGLCLALAALLAACAAVGPPAGQRDLRTDSDLTESDRRAQVRLELASAYFARGQTEVALDEVKQALAANPELAAAHELRGLVYAQLGETALAEESFARALQLAPRNGSTMHNVGWYFCQQQRWPEAGRWFGRALAQPGYRDPVRTLLAWGVCLQRAGQPDAARDRLAQALELDPSHALATYHLAEVQYLRRDDESARSLLARLRVREPDLGASALWLGVLVERRRGDAAAADAWGRQLLASFPDSVLAQRYREGRFDE
jgi:type IV pilus assembly protein PilF